MWNAEWERVNQDYLKERYLKQIIDGNYREYPIRKIICYGCGDVFYTRIQSKKYCNYYTCGKIGNYKNQLQHRLERRKDKICESCGKTFTPNRSDAKYCSNACRQRAYRQRVTDKPSDQIDHLVEA